MACAFLVDLHMFNCLSGVIVLILAVGINGSTLADGGVRSSQQEENTSMRAFLRAYCLDCHQGDTAEGKRNFEFLTFPIRSEEHLELGIEIIDQLRLGQMPPKDAEQPNTKDRAAFLEVFGSTLEVACAQVQGDRGQTVMRRLSHREYENTLAVLFNRRVDTLGLTAKFPTENLSHHVDTIGESLVTSGFLLDQYFQSASRLVDMRLGKPLINPKTWHFKDNFKQYEELTGSHQKVFDFDYLCLYEQPNTDTRQGGYGHIEEFLSGVPVSGLYDIEVLAQSFHRDTHYDPKIFRIDLSEPFQLAIVPGDVRVGHIHYPQAIEPILGIAVVSDNEPTWLKFQVWLEAGQTPRFIFPNGPYESRASVLKINNQYKDEFDPKTYRSGVSRAHILQEGALPHIRIDEIKIHGPLHEDGGSHEEQAVFGSEGFQAQHAVEQLLVFARKAYRRPLSVADKSQIKRFYERQVEVTGSPRQAALNVIKMIICSPSFLYLAEVTPTQAPVLDAYDLASRLSFALWASPPDEELMQLARSGTLTESRVLRSQVDRLIEDERSNEFTKGFLESWLCLRDLGDQPPPRKSAPEYYAENLPFSMKEEARHFFNYLLHTNASAVTLLSADFTFIDKRLASLYGFPEAETMRLADGFRKVSVRSHKRGGILGMAGVLTVSANGVETSPITRGVWVMENILGTPPPPPPPEIPALEANVSDATTIREKLFLHSKDQACFVCHKKIDPLGFPLESFDPVGRWREKYPKAKKKGKDLTIDPSGELLSGEVFQDFDEFKHVLVTTRKEVFLRCLTEKLLSYASGRHMTAFDWADINEILENVKNDDNGLRSLVLEVLDSPIVRSR